jgi:NADH-quinone oxidoreductase subunit E
MAVRRLAAPSLQPKSFAFSAENLAWAEKEMNKYPQGRQASAVIALLWRAQAQSGGWLPEAAIRYVADLLNMASIRVLEIATFYTMFNLEPVGRFYVQVCGTTPCMLRGAEDLKVVCRKRIGEAGRVSADGMFSWIEVECLGACVNAPMLQINEDNYEDLNPEILSGILNDLAAGRIPKPGPQIDRQYSAPLGGPTTLTTLGRAPAVGKTRAGEDPETPPSNDGGRRPARSEV